MIACGPVTGDWYDAAKIYRKWLSSLPEWQPIYQRTTSPAWFANLSIWYQGQDRNPPQEKMDKHVNRLLKIRERVGEPIGFHWYLWEKTNWYDPDLFPAKPGFKEAIAAVEKAGVHVMPYIDIELFDSASPIWTNEKVEPWASRDAYHEFYKTGEWTANSKLLNMCPATTYWQDRMVSYVKTLVQDYGVKAVYLDELHVYPFLCYAKNHGHPATGGTYFRDAYRKMIQRMKAESGIKNLVLTGEGCTEAYADLIDGQLNGLCDTRPDSIPLFQSVMKDNTIEWGLFISQAEVDTLETFAGKIGHAFVRGRQLGWINLDQFDLLKPAQDRQVEFLRKLAVARRAGKEFLLYGEFLRTPDLAAVATHKVPWMVTATSKHEEMTMPDVLAEAYRAPDGDIGIVLANITDAPVTAAIPVNTKEWGLKPGRPYQRSAYRNGAWSPAKTITLPRKLEVNVPAWSPLIVRYRPISSLQPGP